jgi:hypothetical protein
MNNLIDDIIKDINPFLDEMIITIENKEDVKFSDTEKKYFKLNKIYDLVKNLNIFLLPTDEIKYYKFYYSNQKITINSVIIRNNNEYYLNTDCIVAGGYNIQRFHYRYLVSTNLEKTNNNDKINEISNLILKLKNKEKLNKKISDLIRSINNYQKQYDSANISFEEYLKKDIIYTKYYGKFDNLCEEAKLRYVNSDSYNQHLIDESKIMYDNKINHNKYILSEINKYKKKIIELENKLKTEYE